MNPGYRDIYARISSAINRMMTSRRSLVEQLKKLLKSVRGVEFMGLSISLSWASRSRADLAEVFAKLDEWAASRGQRTILVIDEAQAITGQASRLVSSLIAHIYDHLENTTVTVSGSEMGLPYRFLGLEDPEHPLYGRSIAEVNLARFTRDQSIDFLEKGFQQYSIKPPRETLEYAAEKLDGIVGWLVEYGYTAVRTRDASKTLVDRVVEKASRLILAELQHMLADKPENQEKIHGNPKSHSERRKHLDTDKEQTRSSRG